MFSFGGLLNLRWCGVSRLAVLLRTRLTISQSMGAWVDTLFEML